jgi:hypothetical protein
MYHPFLSKAISNVITEARQKDKEVDDHEGFVSIPVSRAFDNFDCRAASTNKLNKKSNGTHLPMLAAIQICFLILYKRSILFFIPKFCLTVYLSYSFSLGEQIGYFWWEDQTASIVSLEEFDHQCCCFFRHVFLDEMACFGYDCELEFAWHERSQYASDQWCRSGEGNDLPCI